MDDNIVLSMRIFLLLHPAAQATKIGVTIPVGEPGTL